MFPIPWNKLFRKKDGSITTLDDVISSGGGGGYTLPPATESTLGGIKVGSGLSVESDGTLSASGGGGGGASLHMYEVTTNQYAALKMFVLTTVNEESLNTYDKLKNVLSTGIGFIVSGQISGTTHVPVFAKHNGSDSSITIYCSMDSVVSNDIWYIDTLRSTATISATKLF